MNFLFFQNFLYPDNFLFKVIPRYCIAHPYCAELRVISARASKMAAFFSMLYIWLATKESRPLRNNSLKMSTVIPIFWCTNLDNIGIIKTYPNFKKSLIVILLWNIWVFVLYGMRPGITLAMCTRSEFLLISQSNTADSTKTPYKARSKSILLRYVTILLQETLF